jgi:hypothetical protein
MRTNFLPINENKIQNIQIKSIYFSYIIHFYHFRSLYFIIN